MLSHTLDPTQICERQVHAEQVSAFRDSSSSGRAVPRNFPGVLPVTPARRHVPAEVRTVRKSRGRICTIRTANRTFTRSLVPYLVGTAGSRRRKHEEENARDAERCDVRRGKRLRAEGETREEEAHTHRRIIRTYARTHVCTYTNNERNESSRVGARESGERFSDLGVSSSS